MKGSADKSKSNTLHGRVRAHGLDGVRALAVLSVIAFHEGLRSVPGGFLGVDVFFVLSGYLITDLLLSRQNGNRLDLSGFWIRRARRLLPAVVTMLATVTAVVTIVRPEQLEELRPALIAAAFYSSNWYQIFHELSYFDSFGPLPPLQHLWSLAVEEQFYLVWPFILGSFVLRMKTRLTRTGIVWLGAAASALTLAFLYHPGDDPSRVYYGTDTHATGLLIGAGLAIFWPLATLTSASRSFARRLDLLGLAGLVFLGWAMTYFTGTSPELYPGGFVLAAFAAAALIAASAAPGYLGTVLGWSPLQWIGVRSYGIYLWHWPVIALTPETADPWISTPWLWVGQTTVTLILAALSWRWIESPILHNGYRNTLRSIFQTLTGRSARVWRAPVRIATVMSLVASVSVACTAGYGVLHPTAKTTDATALKQQIAEGEQLSVSTDASSDTKNGSASVTPEPAPDLNSTSTEPSSNSKDSSSTETSSASEEKPVPVSGDESAQKEKPLGSIVSAIGDSIMLASAPQLQAVLPDIYIDAKVSRHMDKGLEVVRKLVDSGQLREVVLVGLGTNGYITEEEVAQMMQLIGPERKVVLINTYEARPWQDEVNRILGEAAAFYPNVVLVNWYDTIKNQTHLLWRDKVHPRKPGAKIYAKIVAEGIRKVMDEDKQDTKIDNSVTEKGKPDTVSTMPVTEGGKEGKETTKPVTEKGKQATEATQPTPLPALATE